VGLSAGRRILLAAADSPRIGRFVQKYGYRLGGSRFVAGESLDAAVPVLRGLNDKGLLTNTTLLGEGVTTPTGRYTAPRTGIMHAANLNRERLTKAMLELSQAAEKLATVQEEVVEAVARRLG